MLANHIGPPLGHAVGER